MSRSLEKLMDLFHLSRSHHDNNIFIVKCLRHIKEKVVGKSIGMMKLDGSFECEFPNCLYLWQFSACPAHRIPVINIGRYFLGLATLRLDPVRSEKILL